MRLKLGLEVYEWFDSVKFCVEIVNATRNDGIKHQSYMVLQNGYIKLNTKLGLTRVFVYWLSLLL